MKPIPEKNINRIVICQAFLDALGGGTYLEIGVCFGLSFFPIRARVKWGVDPAYSLPRRRLWTYRWRAALQGSEERLFSLTSDDFFASQRPMLARRGVQVAFLDGLHTYEQTLRDVENTLEHLEPGGVMVIHDCNPISEVAATPAASYAAVLKNQLPGWNDVWNGDVWKVIVHLRSLRPDLEALVLDCDHGVGVVRRRPGTETLRLSAEQIGEMQYADLALNRTELLGLKPAAYLWEMVEQISKDVSAKNG